MFLKEKKINQHSYSEMGYSTITRIFNCDIGKYNTPDRTLVEEI